MASFYLNGGLAAVGAIAIYFSGGLLFRDYLNLSPAAWAEMREALPWVACMLPIALLSGVALGALESRERFLVANILQTTGTAAGQILPALCAVYVSPSLSMVLPVAFSVRFLSLLALVAALMRDEKLRFYAFEPNRGRSLFKYGLWVTISNVIAPVLTSLDQLLISAKLGPALLTFYSIPMNLSTRIQVLASALARSVFPRFSRYEAEAAIDLAERATVALAYLFGAACVGAMFVLQPFFMVWMDADFAARATPVGQILLMGVWINGLALIALSLIQGQGHPDRAAKLHVVELLPFVAILWLLIAEFGLKGAAIAWDIRVAVDAVALFVLARTGINMWLKLLPAMLIMGLSYLVASHMTTESAITHIAAGVVAGLLQIATGLAADPSLRRLTLSLLKTVRA